MPTKKDALIAKYKEWDGRPVPLFNTETIQAEMTLNNNNNDDELECFDNENDHIGTMITSNARL